MGERRPMSKEFRQHPEELVCRMPAEATAQQSLGHFAFGAETVRNVWPARLQLALRSGGSVCANVSSLRAWRCGQL